jgi:hypothetical protein
MKSRTESYPTCHAVMRDPISDDPILGYRQPKAKDLSNADGRQAVSQAGRQAGRQGPEAVISKIIVVRCQRCQAET